MYCIGNLDIFGKPFWEDKKLFGSRETANLKNLDIILQSCGTESIVNPNASV
jgi:hypothetical protein